MSTTKQFRLTYNVVTEESAEQGDYARHGFVTRNLTIPPRTYLPAKPATFGLREAVAFLLNRSSNGLVEADSCPVSRDYPPRWFSYGGEYDNEAQGNVTVSLHLPRSITPSTAMRIARVLKCYGVRS